MRDQPSALVILYLCGCVALVALLIAGCTVERRVPIEVTPGTVPEQIRDARWQSFPVTYCVVPDDSGFVDTERLAALAEEAFRRWGVAVEPAGECDAEEQGNGRNEITWGSPDTSAAIPGHEGVFQAGFTRQLFQSCPGGECEGGAESRIVEADILIEPSPHEQFESEECLLATLLHETGHFLGVPHLESPAVMAPASSECPQELTAADREAFAELYPDAAAVAE